MALSLAARRALLDLDAMTGHRRSLAHGPDRREALAPFVILLDRGERPAAVGVEAELRGQGRGPKRAAVAAASPGDIAAVRSPDARWDPEQVARWFGAG